MKTIQLTNGGETLVDDEDYDYLMQWKWYKNYNHASKKYYVTMTQKPYLLMHRAVTKIKSSKPVDHKDFNTLNNQKYNLRIVTRSQNAQNRIGATKTSRTEIRGVSYHKRVKKYQVEVRVNCVRHSCGYFSTLEEAEQAAIAARLRLMTHSDGR